MLLLSSLDDWWQALAASQQVFWVIACISSALFVALFGMSLLGVDADTDADVDFDVDHDTGHDFSLDKDFSAFSVRSIIAFLTFFGWTGVYLLSQGSSVMWAILVATMSGAAAMFVVAYMIFKFAQLEKSTTVNVYNALDRTGEVYLSIPQHLEGKGKIHIVVDGSLHEFDATTNGLQLPTGSHVRVVDVLEGQVLLVEPELELLDQPKS
jgi:hypothetical protein